MVIYGGELCVGYIFNNRSKKIVTAVFKTKPIWVSLLMRSKEGKFITMVVLLGKAYSVVFLNRSSARVMFP